MGRLAYARQQDRVAALDGTGGGQLVTTGATVKSPLGVVVDHASGRVYWTNLTGDKVSFARLDGTGGGDLATGSATVHTPFGVAVDPVTGRVYWTNRRGGSVISFANLDGSGGGNLGTPGAASHSPVFAALLAVPRVVDPPAVSGNSRWPAALSCSQGSWAPDVGEAFYYRAPQTFAYQWMRNGRPVAGATGSALAADPAGGTYQCEVTARNAAGPTVQPSAAHPVAPAVFARATGVTMALAGRRVGARGPVSVRVANANAFPLVGTLSAQTAQPLVAHGRRVALRRATVKLAAHTKLTVRLALPRALWRAFASRRRLSLALTAVVKDPAGHRRTVKKTVTIRR